MDPSDPRIASVHRRSAAYGSLIFGARTVSQQIEGVDFAAEEHFRRGLQVREGSVEDLSDPQLLILPAKRPIGSASEWARAFWSGSNR